VRAFVWFKVDHTDLQLDQRQRRPTLKPGE